MWRWSNGRGCAEKYCWMGNERLNWTLLDRLTHRVHIIEANGESNRLKDARKRRRKPRGAKSPLRAKATSPCGLLTLCPAESPRKPRS